MCCRTDSFCCTRDTRMGIIIAGIVDVFLLSILIIANLMLIRNVFSLWWVVVIVADVLLICGALNRKPEFLMGWMIVSMINIVFLFIGWIAIPVMVFVTHVGMVICTDNGLPCNDGVQTYLIMACISMGFFVVLPIYYIYLWVVVKNYRDDLVHADVAVLPLQFQR